MVIQWGPAANAPAPINPNGANNLVQQMQNFWQAHGGQITAGGVILVGIASQLGGEPGDPLDWNDFGNEGANMPGDANVGDLLDHAAEADALLAEKEQLSQQIFQALFDGDEQLALELTEMFNSVVGQIGMLPGNN